MPGTSSHRMHMTSRAGNFADVSPNFCRWFDVRRGGILAHPRTVISSNCLQFSGAGAAPTSGLSTPPIMLPAHYSWSPIHGGWRRPQLVPADIRAAAARPSLQRRGPDGGGAGRRRAGQIRAGSARRGGRRSGIIGGAGAAPFVGGGQTGDRRPAEGSSCARRCRHRRAARPTTAQTAERRRHRRRRGGDTDSGEAATQTAQWRRDRRRRDGRTNRGNR